MCVVECGKGVYKVAVELDACRRAALQNENAVNAEFSGARKVGGWTLRLSPYQSTIWIKFWQSSSVSFA